MEENYIDVDWMQLYYAINYFWVTFNVLVIVPFLFSCFMRLYYRDFHHKLWSDHVSRLLLFITWVFYIVDMAVKYKIDGAQTICEKGFFIHHFSSLFVIGPLLLNGHIPWWANPVGFMHGFLIKFPEVQPLIYIYPFCLIIFHHGLYQEPYRSLKFYGVIRFFINFIWIFCALVLLDNCSNYLPEGPDQ